MKKRGIAENQKGYSLVELIVSLAILGIIAVPLSGYFITSAWNNRLARAEMEAGQTAQRIIEQWKASGNVATGTTTFTEGPYTIVTTAAAVTHSIAGTAQTPYSGGAVIPDPAAAAVENYEYSGATIALPDAEISITSASVSVDGALGTPAVYPFGTPLNVTVTSRSAGVTIGVQVNGSATSSSILFSGIGSNPRILIQTDGAVPSLTVNGSNTTETTTATVYVLKPFGSTELVALRPQTDQINMIDNLYTAQSTNRLYTYTVSVRLTTKQKPLVILTGYKRVP